jgi:hypothetical protein
MFVQPGHKRFAVFDRRLSKAPERPNLGTMIFDRATLPAIFGPTRRGYLGLPGNVLDDSLRHLILIRREASFHLKKLQQERESQSADTALVHQQHKFPENGLQRNRIVSYDTNTTARATQ